MQAGGHFACLTRTMVDQISGDTLPMLRVIPYFDRVSGVPRVSPECFSYLSVSRVTLGINPENPG